MFFVILTLSACGGRPSDADPEPVTGTGDKSEIWTDSAEHNSTGSADVAAADPDVVSESAAVEGRDYGTCGKQGYQSGQMTAGEQNDNHDWSGFLDHVQNLSFPYPVYDLNPVNRIAVHVSDHGKPVRDAKVFLLDGNGKAIWKTVSDYEGFAYVFYQTSSEEAPKKPAKLVAMKERQAVSASVGNGQIQPASYESEISLELKDSKIRHGLDVMFVFDTTGSMSDELSYLQDEFQTIAYKTKAPDIRFSTAFYRDHGDEYVVKQNSFTNDVKQAAHILKKQYADGGGDYEEAVEEALAQAVFDQNWGKDTTKLLFLILDAPPHNRPEVRESLQITIKKAAEMGIRIIPVAASGINEETENLLRTFAIFTGGTYTFLTDDSGIGDSHLEPSIENYDVEYLGELIIRLINQYNN